jgi:zinc D-Ala-D-Ala carboxypeptidase
MKLSQSFTLAELTVTGSGLPNTPSPVEQDCLRELCTRVLQPLRDHVGVPIVVSSGYRSQRVNAAAGGAASSQHRLGQAADFNVAGLSPRHTCQTIIDLRLPFDQLIQEFGRWVHVSYGPRNRRQVLTATKKGSKTVYLPGLV